MSRAAKKTSRNTKLKVVGNDKTSRQVEHLRLIESEQDARLEYEQNRKKFLDFKPRNKNQELYLEYIKNNRLVFALGCAGTGKTLVATLYACEQLESQQIERIIVTRPMIGCDENFGYLPGNEEEKYIGWVGPILEILEARLGKKRVKTLMEYDKIQLKPLMMMRGSTFRDAIVILDEAQNTTVGQMKMFLTRIGEGSKIIVNGDIEQSDLKEGIKSGLEDATERLRGSKIVKTVEFTESDIVRDPLVREIVKMYRKK